MKFSARILAAALAAITALVFGSDKAPTMAASNHRPSNTARIDGVVERTMQRLHLPSVSLAIVRDGRIAYIRAYGSANVGTRYEIGSVTKQFTAASILLLQQNGRLHLDDPISKYLPELPHSDGVTIRELLTHTSGYDDYYATLSNRALFEDTSLETIVRDYASRPLDFAPGTSWNYSNTGYAILTELIERVSGMDYGSFVRAHIFRPLSMTSALYESRPAFGTLTAVGYDRILLGPQEVARPEGAGWLNGAAGLAMTAKDLARWDVALIDDRLLSATSTREMYTEQHLRSGASTGYGLGVYVTTLQGHLIVYHAGEVQGFTSENGIIPASRFAVVVLCNQENSIAPGFLSGAAAGAYGLFPRSPDPPAGSEPIPPTPSGSTDTSDQHRLQTLFYQMQQGHLHASFTADEAAIATPQRLQRLSEVLRSFGHPTGFTDAERHQRGDVSVTTVYITFHRNRALTMTVAWTRSGRIADLLIEPN